MTIAKLVARTDQNANLATSSMMAPAATSPAASSKAGAFDVATLFVADKAARDEAAVSLAATAKKEGVEFFGSIGLCDALVKVS